MSAIGTVNDDCHPHVLRLAIIRNRFDHAVCALLFRLPPILQAPFRKIFPGYFLPPRVVLKKLKPDWDEEFDHEKRIYQTLKPLQGDVIPVLYGEGRAEGTRALILSEVVGVVPFEQKGTPLAKEEFKGRVEKALGALDKFGLAFGDTKLDNVILSDDRAVLVDLEWVFELAPDHIGRDFGMDLRHLVYTYCQWVLE